MRTSFAALGKRHALQGIRALAHRNCRPYDSASANRAYYIGYSQGTKERYATTGQIRLDYTKPANNRFFGETK